MEKIERRLERAFLLTHSIRRNAERVTAEELRMMALDLETTMGGYYSVLGDDLQKPNVHSKLRLLRKRKAIPHVPSSATQISIITGLEALGRGNDWNRTMQFLTAVRTSLGEEGLMYVKKDKILNLAAMSVQFDPDEILHSVEKVEQKKREQEQLAMAQTAVPEVLRQGGQLVQQQQQLANQPNPQQGEANG